MAFLKVSEAGLGLYPVEINVSLLETYLNKWQIEVPYLENY
jgi:hypothetical protein